MIKTSEFVISNEDWKKCPDKQIPEYAFIGRSNVGKSSLINYLTENPGLAKTSSKPGKTQTINHFLINAKTANPWYLVDLPGYGYATVSKVERAKFKGMIESYILYRTNLCLLFVLLDCRHSPLENDIEFIRWCGANNVPISLILTKTDKISNSLLKTRMIEFEKTLEADWENLPRIFTSSSEKKQGAVEILSYIDEINQSLLR